MVGSRYKEGGISAEAFRRAPPTGLAGANLLGAWAFAETIQSRQKAREKEIAYLETGSGGAPHRR